MALYTFARSSCTTEDGTRSLIPPRYLLYLLPHHLVSLFHSLHSSYLTARGALRTATSIAGYLEALQDLRTAVKAGVLQAGEGREHPLGVPVKWVKQQLPGAERMYQVLAV